MLVIVYIDALVLVIYGIGLCWVNLGLGLWLTRRRQTNLPHHFLKSTYVSSSTAYDGVVRGKARAISVLPPQVFVDQRQNQTQRAAPIDEQWRLPTQPGSPDQVVIHIEPDGLQTEGQRNIQRIIEHLQKMPNTASSPEVAS